MNYQNILDCSIADGEGVRVVLFVTGCSHNCKGCHNPECQNPNNGKLFTEDVKNKLFSLIDKPYIDGLTLSGGDPLFSNNRDDILKLVKEFKLKFSNKTIWLYTGYKFCEIKDLEILNYIDILVDGEFKIDEKDITLPFRGSSNQCIINVREALNK